MISLFVIQYEVQFGMIDWGEVTGGVRREKEV